MTHKVTLQRGKKQNTRQKQAVSHHNSSKTPEDYSGLGWAGLKMWVLMRVLKVGRESVPEMDCRSELQRRGADQLKDLHPWRKVRRNVWWEHGRG